MNHNKKNIISALVFSMLSIIAYLITYNNKVEMFPSNIFAGLFGYKSKAMFEASANERENVKVEL